MPLDTSQGLEKAAFKAPYSVDELRFALVGNNDLKRHLLKEASFAIWLRDALTNEVNKLCGKNPISLSEYGDVSGSPVEELQKLVVILRLVSESVLVVSRPVPPQGLFVALAASISTLFNVVEFVQDADFQIQELLERIVCDIFEILLVLGNTSCLFAAHMDLGKLWSFLCSLKLFQTNRKIATSALNAVPFLLQQMSEASPREIQNSKILITNLLQALTRIFEEVSSSYISLDYGFQSQDMPILQATMVAVAQLLNCVKDLEPEKHNSAMKRFFERPSTNDCMMSLLYIEDAHVLNLATLNLFQLQLLSSSEINTEEGSTHETFQRLFPRIIEILERDTLTIPKYLNFAISVLSDLCLKYSGVCVHLRNTNTDLRILKDLLSLFENSSVFIKVHQIKLTLKTGKRITDFTSLGNGADEVTPESWFKDLDVIANFLLLLSVYTSANEDFRRRITSFTATKTQKNVPNFICLMIFEMTETYRFLINQLLLNYEIFRQTRHQDFKWIANNISVLVTLLEHPIFTNNFYLMRSLSRSVSTLRTFFVDCNSIRGTFDVEPEEDEDQKQFQTIIAIVEGRYDREVSFDRNGNLIFSMLDILSKLEVATHVLEYFTSSSEVSRLHKSRKDLYVKKVIALSSVANFILDFSSFRYEIVKRAAFLSDLASLLQNSLQTRAKFANESPLSRESREISFEQLRIQFAVLQVIKNYLYNENEENRKVIWNYIPLGLIFEKALYGVATPIEEFKELHSQQLQQKVISLEILRNLTAASTHFSESMIGAYEAFVSQEQSISSFDYVIPSTWDQFIVKNLMCYYLFEDIEAMESDPSFYKDDSFVLQLIKNPDYVKVIVAINYIEDHRYTNLTEFSGIDFPSPSLLRIWKRLLGLRISPQIEASLCSSISEKVHLSNQLSEIKLSISWILINLTWKDGEFDFLTEKSSSFADTISSSHSNSDSLNMLINEEIDVDVASEELLAPEARAKLLYKQGFSQVLQKLVDDMSEPRIIGSEKKIDRFDHLNSNDVYEKAKAAHFQIVSLVAKTSESSSAQGSIHPLRRSSNIIHNREGNEIRSGLRSALADNIEEESLAEENTADEDEDVESESEEIDEYWIR